MIALLASDRVARAPSHQAAKPGPNHWQTERNRIPEGGVCLGVRTRLDHDFEAFVRARSASLLRTAVFLVGDVEHGQDILQQALWRTHQHWSRVLDPDAYARKALVNLARDRHRLATRRVMESVLTDATEPVSDDAANAVIDRDELMSALRSVPAKQRATLVLRFWDDLSVEETAAVLECSPGTVKSNTSRGLTKLRDVLNSDQQADAETGHTP